MSKLLGLGILIAIIIALVAYTQPFQNPIVNNTDLYGSLRTNDTVYWSNDTITDVYIIFHGVGTGASQSFDSNFSVNGIVLQDKDFRTTAAANIHEHWSFYVRVPKGANYSILNSTNVYQIEWREYKNR